MGALESQRLARGIILLLGILCALFLFAELVTITVHVPKNPNEGWNAYHALDALRPGAAGLYPGPDSMMFNNYPPLSFFVVGAVTRLVGDAVIAGRLVSLFSTIAAGFFLYGAARALGCARRNASVTLIVFWAAPWVISKLTAMNDPQMFGTMLDTAGLFVVLRGPRRILNLAVGAALLTLAEYVKALYIVVPAALLIWLFVHERRSAFILAGFGFVFAACGLVLVDVTLGIDLFHHIFSPRMYDLSKVPGQPGQWLLTETLPLIASLALLRRRSDRAAFFCGVYALIGFVLFVYFSGGEGVSGSQTIDASMAVALGAALALERMESKEGGRFLGLGRWRWVQAVAALQILIIILSFFGEWSSRPSIPALYRQRPEAARNYAFLAARRDPVLCEMLAFCFWAGRAAEVDSFGLGQAFQRGLRPESDLIARLDARAFGAIQLTPRSSFAYSPAIEAALARDYRLDHADEFGKFLLPRR